MFASSTGTVPPATPTTRPPCRSMRAPTGGSDIAAADRTPARRSSSLETSWIWWGSHPLDGDLRAPEAEHDRSGRGHELHRGGATARRGVSGPGKRRTRRALRGIPRDGSRFAGGEQHSAGLRAVPGGAVARLASRAVASAVASRSEAKIWISGGFSCLAASSSSRLAIESPVLAVAFGSLPLLA